MEMTAMIVELFYNTVKRGSVKSRVVEETEKAIRETIAGIGQELVRMRDEGETHQVSSGGN
jgi:hypothetical protein